MLVGITSTFRSLLGASNQPKSASRLEKDLSNAVRAEGPSHENLRYGQDGASVADGLFICRCGTENTLMHFRGDHPFKRLCCRACNSIYSKGCATSDILQVGVAKPPQRSSRQVRVGQLCPECGLTHRAVMRNNTVSFAMTCVCGNMADESWIRFSIGSHMDYRRNPDTFPTELSISHKIKLVEEHNRAERKTRIEEQKHVGEYDRVEEPVKLLPIAPLCRQKVVYCGGKRYEAEVHRTRMHLYTIQSYGV